MLTGFARHANEQFISTSNDLVFFFFLFFLRTSHREQHCPCVEKLKGVEVCSLKFLQNYFQYITLPSKFRWKLQTRLKYICYFFGSYPPRDVFQTSHQKRIEFDNKTLRAKYECVQRIAGCESGDDMSVGNQICNIVIQK